MKLGIKRDLAQFKAVKQNNHGPLFLAPVLLWSSLGGQPETSVYNPNRHCQNLYLLVQPEK